MRRILNTFAEYERKKINERTSRALQAKKAQGFKLGAPPFGYNISEDRKTFVENNVEQEIITQVRTLRGNGFTWKKVSCALNKMGYTNRRGNTWSTNLCSITFREIRKNA